MMQGAAHLSIDVYHAAPEYRTQGAAGSLPSDSRTEYKPIVIVTRRRATPDSPYERAVDTPPTDRVSRKDACNIWSYSSTEERVTYNRLIVVQFHV